MDSDTERHSNPGVAALQATMRTLAQAVSELHQDTQRDHDTIVRLEGLVGQAMGELRQLSGAIQAMQQQLAPNAEEIRHTAESKILLAQKIEGIDSVLVGHIKGHETAFAKFSSGAFWVFAGLVGFIASLMGDWLKKKLGIGGGP